LLEAVIPNPKGKLLPESLIAVFQEHPERARLIHGEDLKNESAGGTFFLINLQPLKPMVR
jgi:hypothetical protein